VLGSTTAGGFQLIASCWDEAMFRRLRSLQVRRWAGLPGADGTKALRLHTWSMSGAK
jgi:hypothetical protein